MNKSDLAGCKREIERCSRLYEGFSDAVPFVEDVYSIADRYFIEHPVAPLPASDQELANEKFRAGESLCLNPALKTADVIGLLKELSVAFIKANPKLKSVSKKLNESCNQFLSESPEEIDKGEIMQLRDLLIRETVLEQDLATFLFSITLSSFYRQHLKLASAALRTDFYEGGDCPLCGETPHYGMLQPEDGLKRLECWLCGTNWAHTRIKCPFCTNTDMDDLGYFTIDEKEVCRVHFCKKCCHYHKIFDARKFGADGEIHLAIHNLASLSHDLLARKEGFAPGSALEWVNKTEIADLQD